MALDTDKNNEVSSAEFLGTFDRWFQSWNTTKDDALTEEQLRNGLNKDLNLFPGGPPPGGPGR